jgi:hypothetical protein
MTLATKAAAHKEALSMNSDLKPLVYPCFSTYAASEGDMPTDDGDARCDGSSIIEVIISGERLMACMEARRELFLKHVKSEGEQTRANEGYAHQSGCNGQRKGSTK